MSVGKKLKKITSIILIIAMVMTSGGIQSFANSVDDIVETTESEKKESSSRKYYDEKNNEKNDEVIENEENDEEETSADYEEEEDETVKESGEESEENESTEESSHETNESETEESSTDNTEEGSLSDESKSIEESETEVETTSAFDEDETIASDSEIDTDTDTIDEEDNTSTASEADYVDDIDEEDIQIASASDVDEENDDKIHIATYSEIFTVATDSELEELYEEASISVITDLLGKRSYTEYTKENSVPAIVVWGDVGYKGSYHVNEGYLGMYIGGKDEVGRGKEQSGYMSNTEGDNGLHYMNKRSIRNILSLEYKNRDEWMPAPQFIKHTGWYVQARGKFVNAIEKQDEKGGVRANDYSDHDFRGHWCKWTNDDLKALWSDFLKVPFKSYGAKAKGGQHLETLINKNGGNFSILNNNQNIRGYRVTKINSNGTYELSLVENVKFNNDWGMKEKESNTSYHIESLDDEITFRSLSDEEYDWTTKYNVAYYGIHVTDAEGNVSTKAGWKNSGWKGGETTIKLWANQSNGAEYYTIKVPTKDKNVYWEDGKGKTYKLIGWVPSYQNMYSHTADYERDNGKKKEETVYRVDSINSNPVRNLNGQKVYKPGETIKWKMPTNKEWPVTFGPFYRNAFSSTNPQEFREGYRYGMADKGVLYIHSDNNTGWNMITKIDRMRNEWGKGNGDKRRQIGSVQYNTIFFSPVLMEYKEKTVTFDLNGGSWKDKNHSNTLKYSNLTTTKLPDASEVTRTGYIFNGWYTAKTDGTEKTSLSREEADANITILYARWIPKQYNIVIRDTVATASTIQVIDGKATWVDMAYNKDEDKNVYEKIPYDSTITLPEKYNIAGFNFIGFSQDKNSRIKKWREKETINVKDLVLNEDGNTYIYPIYEELKTTIHFIGGDVVASDNKRFSSKYGQTKTFNYYGGFMLPEPDGIAGFDFAGWEVSRTVGRRPEKVLIPANDPKLEFTDYTNWFAYDSTWTYTATWKEKEYTIDFKGGKIKASDEVTYTSSTSSVVTTKYYSKIKIPTNFTLKDFTLNGFAKEENSDSIFIAKNADVTAGSISSDLSQKEATKLYGRWIEDEVKVVFNGGKSKASDGKFKESKNKVDKTYKLKSKVEIPQNFTLEGFNFKGFNLKDQADTVTLDVSETNKKKATELVSTFGKNEDGDLVFYGVWDEKKYNIEIEAGNKEENGKTYEATGSVAAKVYGYHSNVSMPTEATMKMKGFKLRGFNKEEGQEIVKYEPDEVVNVADLIEYLSMEEYKSENANPYKLYAVWDIAGGTIKLKANIGYFSDNKREKTLKPEKMGKALNEYDGYEEPVETDDYVFSHWEDKDKNKYNGESILIGDIELSAQYKDKPKEEIKVPTYTIKVVNDDTKGTYDGPTSFELRLGDNVRASMSEAGIIPPVANDRWTFLGWSFDGINIISDVELYTDTSKNEIKAVYKENTITIVLSSETGKFKNGERVITIVSTKSVALNEYDKYEEPTKEGYTFKNWLDGSVEVASTSVITRDVTLVANYEEIIIIEEEPKYTIAVLNDDTLGTYAGPTSFELVFDSIILSSMSEAGVTNPVANEGYTFLGWSWNGDKNNLVKEKDRYIDISLATISTVYSQDTYTVTLSARDGKFANGEKTKTITSHTKVALNTFAGYEEPTKEEYVFKNWTSEGVEVASNSIITSDMTLVANFEKAKSEDDSEDPENPKDPEEPAEEPKYIITVLNDDTLGTYAGPTSFELVFDSIILSSMSEAGVTNPVANEGYTFLGWSWNGDKNNLVKEKDRYIDISLATISTVYSQDTYTVTLSARDGKFANGEKTKTITSHTKVALNTFAGYEEPTKEEYVFKNWTSEGVEVASNSIITSDMTLVANFEKAKSKEETQEVETKYTITVVNDDKLGTYVGPSNFKLDFGSDILASMSEFGVYDPIANEDWTFLGWSWTGEKDNLVKSGEKYIDISLATISTVYSQDTYTVTLSAGDGEFANGEKIKKIKSHSKIALNKFEEYEVPTKEDYEFVRWIDVNEVEIASTSIITKDTVLYATFKRIAQDITDTRYTVTISNDSEKGVIKVKKEIKDQVTFKIDLGNDILLTLASASITAEAKSGYVFKGWSWTGDIASLIKPGDLYADTKNTDLKAVYTRENERTVVLKANTGIFKSFGGRTLTIASDAYRQLTDFNKYEEPVKEKATFNRWIKEDGTTFTKDTYVDADMVLTAIYKDENGNDIGLDDNTKEDGANASYTVLVKNDIIKGTMSNAERVNISGQEFDVALIDIKINDKILEKISEKGLTVTPDADRWIYEGWSTTDSLNDLIGAEDVYDSKDLVEINAAYYKIIHIKVVLNANTGVFMSSGERIKEMNNNKKIELGSFRGYEEPVKSEGYTFVRWEDSSYKKYETTHEFGEESDNKTIELFAIYKDSNGNIVGRGETKDGGAKAYYTVFTKYDPNKASHISSSFEVQKDALVKQAMIDYNAYEAVEVEGWWEKGWSFDNTITNLIDDATLYNDVSQTMIYAQYVDTNKWTIVLSANTGLFSDNTREKVLVNTRKVAINRFSNYEVPEKADGYRFDHWEDASGKVYKPTDYPPNPFDLVLYAIYKDNKGNEIGKDETKDGGSKAIYTIRLSTDTSKGTLGSVKKFEIAKGSYILATMSEAGVKDPTPKNNNYFVGWTWDKDLYEYVVTNENIYKGNEGTVLHALYSDEIFDVTIRANTGLFNSDNSREKSFQVPKYQLLKAGVGYEEPVKTNATFNRWLKNGAPIGDLKSYMITEPQTLDATYSANDGSNDNIGKDDDTEDGGENATYTIRIVNNRNFGDYRGAEYFEVKVGDVIYTTMKEAGVTEGVPKPGYAFKGWKLEDKLISALTRYEDTNITTLDLEYGNQTIQLTLDASFGRFKDKSQVKVYNVARGRVINTIEDYEEPTKQNWTFSKWVDEYGNEVASSSELPLFEQRLKLKAKYKNANGEEVDEDGHSHLICGATDEVASHAVDVIPEHTEKMSYFPVTNAEEFMDYINIELAKEATERNDIKLYLEDDIVIDESIELDDGMNLYICLNGHKLSAVKLGSKVDRSGNVYITNCKEAEAIVLEKTTEPNLKNTFFGTNSLHILTSKGKINVNPTGRLVDIISSDSIIEKELELMNVRIENIENTTTDILIKAKGNTHVRLEDVDIRNIKVTDTLLAVLEGADLLVGGELNIEKNTTNRAIMDIRESFRFLDNSVISIVRNNIVKTKNGDTAIVFIGGDQNYIGGKFEVKGNKLELSDDYKELVNKKPLKEETNLETNNEDEILTYNKNFRSYNEEKSPAGEVGYSSAVAFTKENTGFDIGNAKIEIYNNESVASDSNVRAEYMYQLRALSNTSNALIRQVAGTEIDEDSIIGVAFATEDGEGVLTDSAKIGKDVFRNKTFGKEESLLNIKENDNNLELMRKTYSVVYYEGRPTTNEQKIVVDALMPDGSTVSDATRVRSAVIKAGYDIQLEGDKIYRAKGFDLATYSLINKNNQVLGEFDPRATISYIDSLFGDGKDIEDGDIIRADSNYRERSLKSEARPLVITKEEYDEMVNAAVVEAAVKVASDSDAEQAIEEKDEDYYTIRYYLEGGRINNLTEQGQKYYEVPRVSKKVDYTLIADVSKVASESGVRKEYNFAGWFLKDGDGEYYTPVTQIIANSIDVELIEVYAQYLPATYKITYHLDGGSVAGYEGDTIEEIVNRLANYTLIKDVTKPDYVFSQWRIEDGEDVMYAEEIEAESITNDIDAYAEYTTALYNVTYNLNGGTIRDVTEKGNEIYVDSKANILYDYYLPQDVIKEDYKFTGWETARGVKVDKIAAGDMDESKRNVTATFAPSTWRITYDTDEGTINGFEKGNVTEKVEEGKEYILYTDVKKDGFEFAYWYDVKAPTKKIEVIKDAVGGSEVRVKAKYNPLTYDLRLHIYEDASPIVLRGLSNKVDFELPKDIAVADKEFVNWSYKDDKGANVFIDYIEAGNPNNITDIYANYEDLMTWKIIYHLGPDEFIEGVSEYDATSNAEEKTKTIVVNRRKNASLYTKVIKNAITDEEKDEEDLRPVIVGSEQTSEDQTLTATEKKYEFYGWTSQKETPDSLDAEGLGNTFKFVDGVSKEVETIRLQDATSGYSKEKEWHLYPYFVLAHSENANIEYYFVNGGELPNKEVVDGKCTETVPAGVDYSLKNYYDMAADSLCEGYVFEGFFLNEACKGAPIKVIAADLLQEQADAGEAIQVYVKFTKIIYNLKYYVNGGSMPGKRLTDGNKVFSTTYDNRNEIILDTNITKEGYVFEGWKTSDDTDAKIITKIEKGYAADVTVYASWKKDAYTITYVLNGGIVSGKPAVRSYKETYSRSERIVLPSITKSRSRFVGWFTQDLGLGTKYEVIEAGQDVGDLTLYAYFQSIQYTVAYVLNGGYIKGKCVPGVMYYIEVHDKTEEFDLYGKDDVLYDAGVFDKWVDEQGKEYTRVEKEQEGSLVLFAQYTTKNADITFHIGEKGVARGIKTQNGTYTKTFNLGKDNELPDSYDITYGALKRSKLQGFYGDEYTFGGWYTNEECTGQKVTTLAKGNPDNITDLYAKWNLAVYNVIFHLNGGEIQSLAKSIDGTSEDYASLLNEYELPTNTKKNNNEFIGWYDNEKLTGNPITKLSTKPKQIKDNTVHLYAKWKKIKNTIEYQYKIQERYYTRNASRVFYVENNIPYVLYSEGDSFVSTFTNDEILFDGWYKKDENGNLVGKEIIYIDENTEEDVVVGAKLLRYSALSFNEYLSYSLRRQERAFNVQRAKDRRQIIINENAAKAAEKAKDDYEIGSGSFEDYIKIIIFGSSQKEDDKQEEDKLEEKNNKTNLFGELMRTVGKLFGDGPEDGEGSEGSDSSEGSGGTTNPGAATDEIEVNTSDLLAYDTVSAKKLGMETPKGTVLDCVVVTYLKDISGNEINDKKYIGKVFKAGSNFSDLAEDYAGHLLGLRAVFIDEKILAKPSQPGGSGNGGNYNGGGGGSGGGGGGEAGGGRLPASHSPIIVNPYGYDGRGNDNGALRAKTLKLDINAKLGRNTTPSIIEYKSIDIADENTNLIGLSNETWEYFPASNEFKLFMTAPNGDRYYLTNGWHAHTSNNQKLWYRFDNNGLMQRGFVEEDGKVYYLNNSLNGLAYMVKGYKEFEGTPYTGYFGDNGVLLTIFPTAARIAFETNIANIPQQPSFDKAIYEQCKLLDRERTRLLRSEKAYGQSEMGNFVGYWYYMATGQKKFRFETIKSELQVARFANDGWMNIYDTDNVLYSYRFDSNANVITNASTPEGLLIAANGHMAMANILLDFSSLEAAKNSGFQLATRTLSTIPVEAGKLKSSIVELDGTPAQDSPATDIWTVMSFDGLVPVLTNSVYGGTSIQQTIPIIQPLQLLSNAVDVMSGALTANETENTIPIIDAVGMMKPLNIVKMTQVLSNVDFKAGVKTVVEVVNDRKITSVYGICMDIYNAVKELLVA